MTPIEYKIYESDLSDSVIAELAQLFSAIFQTNPGDDFKGRVLEKRHLSAILAYQSSQPVAYKLGYARNRKEYYSWLGGVLPGHRRQGIASKLIDMQHAWCQQQGYQQVITESKNEWKDMIVLNLKHGMEIRGCYTDDHGDPKIIMVKQL